MDLLEEPNVKKNLKTYLWFDTLLQFELRLQASHWISSLYFCFSTTDDGYQKMCFFVIWQYYNCILSFIYLQMYRFELVRLLIWCSTYILISIGVLDTSSCFFHFSITCGDILHWVATNVITDICSKIDQNYIKNHFGSQISNFCQKSSKVAVGLLGYLHNQQFSLHKISFAKYNVDWFLSN